LKDAIVLANENYPALKASQLNIDKEYALKGTAWDFGNTRVFIGGDEIGNTNSGTYTTLGIGQTNMALFSIASKNRLANENIKKAETSLELNLLELKQKVESAWVKAYATKQIFESYKEIDTVFSGLKEALDLRFETEAISRFEYNATVNEGKLIKLQREQYYVTYQIALQELNQWIFAEDFYDVAEVSLYGLDTPIDLLNQDLKEHPLYSLWESELLVAKAKQKVSNSQYLPTISAQYGIQKIGDQTGYNSYQLGVQIPLIFGKTRGLSRASKIDVDIIKQENKVKEIRLKSSFKITLSQHNQLKVSWKYYKEEALPLAIEQRNVAAIAYKEGSMDYIAFIQTMKNAIELEISTWTILQKYAESKINLTYFLTTKS